MSKQEFLVQLEKCLSGLPMEDVKERLNFYSEMIDDHMEEGVSEREAVAAVGSVEDIAAQVVADVPFTRIAKESMKPKRKCKVWEIVLLVLGSPIWFSLGIAAFAVFLSVYITLLSVIVSLWAVFVSSAACGVGLTAAGIVLAAVSNVLPGIAAIGAGMACTGFSIFMFYGCKAATKGFIFLTKKFAFWIKNCLIRKEAVL